MGHQRTKQMFWQRKGKLLAHEVSGLQPPAQK